MAAAVAKVVRLAGRPLASLTADQLKALTQAGMDITLSVFEEQARRKRVSGSAGHLKLAAEGGELTSWGRAIVQVRLHNAGKTRGRRSA